jgi:phage terminase small subunit
MAGLTDKQRLFVEAYLTCWNATEAARQAQYAGDDVTLASIGYENLRKPQIAGYVRQRLSEAAMTADEVLSRLADQARSSMADFLNETGRIDLELARKNGKLHLVKSRSVTKEGERIELYSAQEALALLGKHHGLFVDRQETGPPGTFAPVREVVIEVPADEPVDTHE